MKKSTILLSTFLLIVFATGCTVGIDVQDSDLDDIDISIDIDENVDSDEVELIEPTGATEGPVTITIEEGTNFNEYLTYLKKLAYEEDWFNRASDDCHHFYKMTESQDYPIMVEDLDSDEVQAALLEILGDEDQVEALTAEIVTRLEAGEEGETSELVANEVCSGDNGVFVIFSESHTTITLTVWDDKELVLEDLRTFDGLIDLSYSFQPDAIDGKAVMMTGYGDAGYLSWNYYLVRTRNNSVTKVESCVGHFGSVDEGENDQFTFECELEYTG